MPVLLIFMENNQLQKLEDIAKEEKDLGSLTNEELFYELSKTKKLFGSVSARASSFIRSLIEGKNKSETYVNDQEHLRMSNMFNCLVTYQHKLNKEVGKRLGLSYIAIDKIDDRVYEDTDW